MSGVVPANQKPPKKVDSRAGSRRRGVFLNSDCFSWKNKNFLSEFTNIGDFHESGRFLRILLVFLGKKIDIRKKRRAFSTNRLANRFFWEVRFAGTTPENCYLVVSLLCPYQGLLLLCLNSFLKRKDVCETHKSGVRAREVATLHCKFVMLIDFRVHAKGGRTLRKGVFLPSKHLPSAFYDTPPSKNPSKNLCLY